METQPESRIARKKADKRRRLLDAALALFADRGYHGTAVPLVARTAGVGAGTVYRFFASKEALVNAVFREAKGRLQRALDGLDLSLPARALFHDFWDRLMTFAQAEPVAFRFLELQDHTPYLDDDSRALELRVLAPVYTACQRFQERGAFTRALPVETTMAFVWGAFVGLVKAERTGYLTLDDAALLSARDACWRAFATDSTPAPTTGSTPP